MKSKREIDFIYKWGYFAGSLPITSNIWEFIDITEGVEFSDETRKIYFKGIQAAEKDMVTQNTTATAANN